MRKGEWTGAAPCPQHLGFWGAVQAPSRVTSGQDSAQQGGQKARRGTQGPVSAGVKKERHTATTPHVRSGARVARRRDLWQAAAPSLPRPCGGH